MEKREYIFKARVTNYDPITNPTDGWVQGYYYQDLDGGIIKHYIFNCPMTWEIDPSTLCEYIGCKDKNGNMIFENDIIMKKDGMRDIVYYNQHDMMYTTKLFDLFSCRSGWYEVIGNIHDVERIA